jgi:beta-N-acetylhexosaminidase
MVTAYIRGSHAGGMLTTLKHFPGHGDTDTDSHLELPRVDHPWDRLEAVELAPFKLAAQANLPMLMTAHVVFAALDDKQPTTLSEKVVTGLLRGKLGYRGVIVSDDLDMRAIAGRMGVDHAAVQAIRAGCDVLLLCCNEQYQAQAEEALIRTAETDSDFARRIGESAARVRAMKKAHAANRGKHPALGRDVVGSFEHRRLADRLAGRA